MKFVIFRIGECYEQRCAGDGRRGFGGGVSGDAFGAPGGGEFGESALVAESAQSAGVAAESPGGGSDGGGVRLRR